MKENHLDLIIIHIFKQISRVCNKITDKINTGWEDKKIIIVTVIIKNENIKITGFSLC